MKRTNPARQFDVCAVGHITWDCIVSPTLRTRIPGGTAYYGAVALARLGLETAVVTRLAGKDREALIRPLERLGVRVFNFESAETTFFENVYEGGARGTRTQKVHALAEGFVPEHVEGVSARMFLLGPLTNTDMPLSLFRSVKRPDNRIAVDVQGMLRRVSGHSVESAVWGDKLEALRCIDVLKADDREARSLTGENELGKAMRRIAEYGVREVLVTLGSQGALSLCEGREVRIPAFEPRRLVDTTGCGDTFLAGYLFGRHRSMGVREAGLTAAALAALKAEVLGPFQGSARDLTRFSLTAPGLIPC
ncbi:MAG: ribokinase [Deltaproteobacteria bacterium]|nr:ribokinase [Deltaproteobacteria bacterium]